jgi:hypothetical protein
MTRWVKYTLIGLVIAIIGFAALAGTGAYYFLRHLDTRKASEADTLKEFDAIRARYPGRQPLIELVNPQAGDIRIHRLVHPEGKRATSLHVLTFDAEDGERLMTDVPLWLMRFSSVNILSKLGIAPDKYRLTVQDVEQYGPGVIADYRRAGKNAVIIWVE